MNTKNVTGLGKTPGRKLTVSVFVSLDGVIQDPGGFGETPQGGWANPYFTKEAEEASYEALMASDYFLCGRISYQLMSKAWGSVKGGRYLERMNTIPKLVASRTLREPLTWNATLIRGDIVEAITRLKSEPGQAIEMYGSGNLLQTLMKHNLVDEFRLWVHPIILGAGKRLFPDRGEGTSLRLVSSQTLSSGVAVLAYVPEKGNAK